MREILQEAIDRYGTEAQLMMVLEEMSELQKEICKWFRGKRDRDAIADEVADVEIMLEQVKIIFDLHGEVNEHIDRKIERLRYRLDHSPMELAVDAPIYDKVDTHRDCTVQILRSTLTGEQSIGWWPNKAEGSDDV